jgi:hypothetical protein
MPRFEATNPRFAEETLSVAEAKVSVVRDGVETPCASAMATVRNFRAVGE